MSLFFLLQFFSWHFIFQILSPERVRGLILVNFSPESISWDNLSYYSDKVWQEFEKNRFFSFDYHYVVGDLLVEEKQASRGSAEVPNDAFTSGTYCITALLQH